MWGVTYHIVLEGSYRLYAALAFWPGNDHLFSCQSDPKTEDTEKGKGKGREKGKGGGKEKREKGEKGKENEKELQATATVPLGHRQRQRRDQPRVWYTDRNRHRSTELCVAQRKHKITKSPDQESNQHLHRTEQLQASSGTTITWGKGGTRGWRGAQSVDPGAGVCVRLALHLSVTIRCESLTLALRLAASLHSAGRGGPGCQLQVKRMQQQGRADL